MEWCQIQAFLKHTHGPRFIWSAWVLSSHLSTTWPCCKLDCLSDTPGYAAARSENQTSTTCSWSENSRFSWIGALWPHSWWIASFFRFSALKRSDHLGMLRRAAVKCRRGMSCKMRPICRSMSKYTCYTNIRVQTILSNAVLRKIQAAHDWLQTIGNCLVIRALPHHIISSIVTLVRLNLPQIARKAKHSPHEAEVKSLDFHR